ncbi:MAG: hypothetical protein CMJ75_03715 [Planctomycetaceae bacterium]|nr:hypothetical protein [Planctomycetaceae bacterium]
MAGVVEAISQVETLLANYDSECRLCCRRLALWASHGSAAFRLEDQWLLLIVWERVVLRHTVRRQAAFSRK